MKKVRIESFDGHPGEPTRPAPFWSDIFVDAGMPWWGFLESTVWHLLVVAALWNVSREVPLRNQLLPRSTRHSSYIRDYQPPPTFRVAGRGARGKVAETRRQADAGYQFPVQAARGSKGGLVSDVKLGEPGQSEMAEFKGAHSTMPFLVSLPSPPSSVVASLPQIRETSRRRNGMPEASPVGPPPEIGQVFSSAQISLPRTTVVEPPPSIAYLLRKVGDVNIVHSKAVPPAPQLPRHERLTDVALGRPGLAGLTVAPPSPLVPLSGSSAGITAESIAAIRVQVVPPPPSIREANSVSGRRQQAGTPSLGFQVVPLAPTIQGPGDSTLQVILPAPSVQSIGSWADSGRGVPSAGGLNVGRVTGTALKAAAPTVSKEGTDSATDSASESEKRVSSGRSPEAPSSLAGDHGFNISAQSGGPGSAVSDQGLSDSAAEGGRSAANIPLRRQALDNPPGPQDLPVRVIGLAMALPSSSFFSNYEVFIAERQMSGGESQLIKLIYISLPYQRRLSEYGLDNSKVYKIHVTRDPSCDETLMQMTWPEAEQARSGPSANEPSSSDKRDGKLPCYRTTADDCRRAISRKR